MKWTTYENGQKAWKELKDKPGKMWMTPGGSEAPVRVVKKDALKVIKRHPETVTVYYRERGYTVDLETY